MALVGNMIAQAFHGGNPASVNYAMFTSAFSMVSLFLLFPMTWKPEWGLHAIVPIILDALNAIFFFTSGIVLAARLGAHSCSNRVRLYDAGIESAAVSLRPLQLTVNAKL